MFLTEVVRCTARSASLRATPSSWFHPGTWRSYFRTIVRGHHRPGYVGGDVGQASGVVRLAGGRVERAAVPAGMTARADFDDLLACPVQPAAGSRGRRRDAGAIPSPRPQGVLM